MDGPIKLECYFTLGQKGLSKDRHSSIIIIQISKLQRKIGVTNDTNGQNELESYLKLHRNALPG
jgi:hypothetical protein